MRITEVECIPVQAPGRTLVPILVQTDAGLTGIGEAGLQRRWHGIAGVVRHLREWLVGEDPFRVEHLWQRLFRGGFYPADKLIGSAIAGIDIALWDLKAQALGVPVYELLGGRCRDWVECFLPPGYLAGPEARPVGDLLPAVDGGDVDAAAELAVRMQANGHRYYRTGPHASGLLMEPGRAVERLIAQLRAVRAAVGDRLELMVDCHTRLDLPEAMRLCTELAPLGIFAVEDPLRSEYPEGYRQLRRQTTVPLAAGEQWANKWEFRQVIEEDLVDYLRIDLCNAAGLTEARKIAGWAETHHQRLLLHNPLGPVCTAACLHLDLACGHAGPQEVIFPPAEILPEVFECAFRLDGIRLTLPEGPGLGVRFNREAAREHPPLMTEPPHFHRPDGAFTNY
ncbi:MAG: mandelate racemase/muconate lactonizing enzyme family protein [Candidatus Latescibacterota bacterium]|jgi:galactonate dehydratase